MINNFESLSFITPLVNLPGEQHSDPIPFKKDESVIYKDSKLPFLTNLYVASLTVVGLFIVFRFVQKSH